VLLLCRDEVGGEFAALELDLDVLDRLLAQFRHLQEVISAGLPQLVVPWIGVRDVEGGHAVVVAGAQMGVGGCQSVSGGSHRSGVSGNGVRRCRPLHGPALEAAVLDALEGLHALTELGGPYPLRGNAAGELEVEPADRLLREVHLHRVVPSDHWPFVRRRRSADRRLVLSRPPCFWHWRRAARNGSPFGLLLAGAIRLVARSQRASGGAGSPAEIAGGCLGGGTA